MVQVTCTSLDGQKFNVIKLLVQFFIVKTLKSKRTWMYLKLKQKVQQSFLKYKLVQVTCVKNFHHVCRDFIQI